MGTRGKYDFNTSREVYTFFKAIYIKKKISFTQLVEDCEKSKAAVSMQVKPLIDAGIVETVLEDKIYYYVLNESKLKQIFLSAIHRPFFFLDSYVVSCESFNGLRFMCENLVGKIKPEKLNQVYSTLWKKK